MSLPTLGAWGPCSPMLPSSCCRGRGARSLRRGEPCSRPTWGLACDPSTSRHPGPGPVGRLRPSSLSWASGGDHAQPDCYLRLEDAFVTPKAGKPESQGGATPQDSHLPAAHLGLGLHPDGAERPPHNGPLFPLTFCPLSARTPVSGPDVFLPALEGWAGQSRAGRGRNQLQDGVPGPSRADHDPAGAMEAPGGGPGPAPPPPPRPRQPQAETCPPGRAGPTHPPCCPPCCRVSAPGPHRECARGQCRPRSRPQSTLCVAVGLSRGMCFLSFAGPWAPRPGRPRFGSKGPSHVTGGRPSRGPP